MKQFANNGKLKLLIIVALRQAQGKAGLSGLL